MSRRRSSVCHMTPSLKKRSKSMTIPQRGPTVPPYKCLFVDPKQSRAICPHSGAVSGPGPAAPNGVILGELLNARMVERALVDAGMTL